MSLYRLGSNTKQKFEEAKRLRSRDTPLTALYLRARLLKFLDEPWQPRARKYLQSALRYRRGDIPPRNTSLILLPVAHDLRTEVRALIRAFIRVEKCNFPPLHLPSDKLVFRKGQPLTQQIIHEELEPECVGEVYLYQFSVRMPSHRHHFRTLDACSSRNSCLATTNLADTTYFSKGKWDAAELV